MKNILLTLMCLDIGGVETHVVELAKQLKKMGYHIIIASNGGVFVKELEEAGIKHYKVPLHTKRPRSVLKSYFMLRKILKEEKIDLIHAHARIPAYICGILHRQTKIPFVTSTHWVFKTGFLYNLLTDWGQKTVAVSEDIKQYLIDNYHFPEQDIIVTINGIDTEKFSADTDYSEIAAEFQLKGKNRIVYCSRMDTDRALAAFQLVAIAPRLAERVEDLEIVIVGGGNEYQRLQEAVAAMNAKIGRRVLIAVGARIDVNQFVAAGDLFVGVSRAALEAMAAQRPVIVAGNEGYIGLFGEDKLGVAVQTNFTCRGCLPSTEEMLYQDILSFYTLSEEERKALGEYGKRVVEERYSVVKMASDTEQAYLPFFKGGK